MNLILCSIFILFISGIASVCITNRKLANYIGASGALFTLALCLMPIYNCLVYGKVSPIIADWHIPYAKFVCFLDSLSCFFMILVVLLCAIGAVFGVKYIEKSFINSSHSSWFWYNLLEIGMISVLISGNSILFIYAWEIMSISAFFLVLYEQEKESSKAAAWIYLISTHIGTFFIIILFVFLAVCSGTLSLTGKLDLSVSLSSIAFLLSLVGFGAKAGFIPVHVWLPEAHPAAPSHVSAVMSGIMIEIGLYGILRILVMQEHILVWWGILLIAVGIISGLFGVLMALAQRNLKRLLAYSSVENVGIMIIGIGLGIIGLSEKIPEVAFLGFCGGFLHILNHSLFKGVLFFSAGSVLHETGSVNIDRLGGLSKKMPFSAFSYFIGSCSIAGLPPFNGFVSEFFIYFAAIKLASTFAADNMILGSSVLLFLPIIGGLVAICFSKSFGIIFLGENRNGEYSGVKEVNKVMVFAMFALLAGCVFVPYICSPIFTFVSSIISLMPNSSSLMANSSTAIIYWDNVIAKICLTFGVLIMLVLVIWLIRKCIYKGKTVHKSLTWDCGFSKPAPRMQYTGTSFIDPAVKIFRLMIMPVTSAKYPDRKMFPKVSFVNFEAPDLFNRLFFNKLFRAIEWGIMKLKWLQNGNTQLYIFYIVIALFLLVTLVILGGI